GGSVDLDASDRWILIGQNGSLVTGDNTRGEGAGVHHWEIHRKAHAIIGDIAGTATATTDFQLARGGASEVAADSVGYAMSFALAADKRTSEPEEESEHGHVQGPDPVDEEAPEDEPENAVGQGANVGKSGWSLAADVSYVDLAKDQVWAFIDDAGTFV